MKYLTKKIKIAALEAVIVKLEKEIARGWEYDYNGSCFMFTDAFKALGFTTDSDSDDPYNYYSDHCRAMDWFSSLRPTEGKYYNYWLYKYPNSAWWFRTSKQGNEQRIKYFKHIINKLEKV